MRQSAPRLAAALPAEAAGALRRSVTARSVDVRACTRHAVNGCAVNRSIGGWRAPTLPPTPSTRSIDGRVASTDEGSTGGRGAVLKKTDRRAPAAQRFLHAP